MSSPDDTLALRCATHPDAPAIALCARCHDPLCHHCHAHDRFGVTLCEGCRQQLSPPGIPWETPSDDNLGAFWQTLWLALRSPSALFQRMQPGVHWSPAVIFGLACLTFGHLASILWQLALDAELEDRLLESLGPELVLTRQALRAVLLARAVMLPPLILLFHTSLLTFALRMSGVPAPRAAVARIFGFACAAHLWLLLPPIAGFPLGHILTMIWLYHLEVTGMQRAFGIPGTRAALVALGPMLLAAALQCI